MFLRIFHFSQKYGAHLTVNLCSLAGLAVNSNTASPTVSHSHLFLQTSGIVSLVLAAQSIPAYGSGVQHCSLTAINVSR